MQTENQGDPTQRTPEEILAELDRTAAEIKLIYTAAHDYVRESIERLESIAIRMERAQRRMEILKQTMRPLPPIVEKDDNRLCAGELAIIRELAAEGPAENVAELALRTQYAQSSVRTWLPMLRVKGLVQERSLELTLAGFSCVVDGIYAGIVALDESVPDVPEGELIKQAPGRPEEERCPS